MSLPELLAERVGDETVVADVPLGGDDRLAVTPTRTLVYRSDGLLSDESVTAYSHDVERIEISTGRRKAKLTLGYGLDGDETVSVPAKRADDVLHPVLAGVLSARNVTDAGESVVRTFRFSELTLVVTSDRLVKHVGASVWDDEFEEFAYADLTDLDFEEGTVATAVVLTHDGRSERFKAPNESARAVRETLVGAVCDFHGVDTLEEFRAAVADDADDSESAADTGGTTDFGEGPDPLSASPAADAEAEPEPLDADPAVGTEAESDAPAGAAVEPDVGAESEPDIAASVEESDTTEPRVRDDPATGEDVSEGESGSDSDPKTTDSTEADPLSAGLGDAEATREETSVPATDEPPDGASEGPAEASADADGFDGSPFETAGVEGEDLATEVAELRRAVEAQSERLDRQSALIEQLIEELRRGR